MITARLIRYCALAAPLLLFVTSKTTLAQSLEEFDADYLESPSGGPNLEAAEQRIIERTDEFRQEHDLQPLESSRKLNEAARYFAAYMARTERYGHTADGNRPSQRAELFGYNYCIVAENIAYQLKSTGFETIELGEKFFTGWRDSPEHRENMLDPNVTETGVAIAHNEQSGRYYAVQMFGRPRTASYRFQVVNRSDQTLTYTVDSSSRKSSPSRTFQLPPLATRTHKRCRPATLDWGWTNGDDEVSLGDEGGASLTINDSDGQLQVARHPLPSTAAEPRE